jgi:hypothetical protein
MPKEQRTAARFLHSLPISMSKKTTAFPLSIASITAGSAMAPVAGIERGVQMDEAFMSYRTSRVTAQQKGLRQEITPDYQEEAYPPWAPGSQRRLRGANIPGVATDHLSHTPVC